MKRILSLWLPLWPVERLRRHNPGAVPEDKPLALVESGARGIRITAVNGVAAREGVRTGMALADARAALPDLLSRPAEPERDRASLERLARWTGRYGPARGVDGRDGIWIDTTGVAHLFGGEPALLIDVRRRLAAFGLTAEAAIAGTHGAAHALARFSAHARAGTHGLIPPGEEQHELQGLPVEALRLEAETVVLLKRLGLKRIGALYDIPRVSLERRFRAERRAADKAGGAGREKAGAEFASAVLARLDQALGLREELKAPLSEPPVLSVRRTWGEPLISAEALENELGLMVAELCQCLAGAALGCRRLRLTLYRADGTLAEVAAGLSAAGRDPAHILRLLSEKIAAIDAGFGIDVMALDALVVAPLGAEQEGLGGAAEAETAAGIAALTDRLVNRLGTAHITCLVPHASHIPERAERRVTAATRPQAAPAAGEERMCALRPAVLLTPPEPVSVMAEVPEGPPRQFTWRRVVHRIVKAAGPERIEPEWWRDLGRARGAPEERAPRPRDYYALEDTEGTRFWVFREGLYQRAAEEGAPGWFVHGLFG